MPSKKSDDQKLADRATDLYWRSGQSVNRIAETMNLSKSALYAIIRPLPAGRSCPGCREAMIYPNRTAKEKANASCLHCEYASEGTTDADRSLPPASAPLMANRRKASSLEATEAEGELEQGGREAVEGPGRRGAGSNRTLWAAILLGVAAGLYVTRRSR